MTISCMRQKANNGFRGTGKKYHSEAFKGVTTAAPAIAGGALAGATFLHGRAVKAGSRQPRSYHAGQGAGSATAAVLVGLGARKGYKAYKKRKEVKH